ncbi:MAG: hypothetical protein RSB47_09285, partial [Ruthenibacterium sp.]
MRGGADTMYGVPTGDGVFSILQCGVNYEDGAYGGESVRVSRMGTLPAGQAYAGEPAGEAEPYDARKNLCMQSHANVA